MGVSACIVLAGTVHLDCEASSFLYSLLGSINPACIAVEISAFSIRYRSRMEKIWLQRFSEMAGGLPVSKRRHLKLELLRRQISMPYEWTTAAKYASGQDIELVPVDSGALSRRELPCWQKDLLSEENLIFLTSLEDELDTLYFSNHFSSARRILKKPEMLSPIHCQLVFDENWCKREELLARRVINLSRRFSPLVYIGGWMHLINLSSRVTLASMLGQDKLDRYLVTSEDVMKL